MGYRVKIYSSHKILGKRGATLKAKKRHYILSSVKPTLSKPPFKTRKEAEKEKVKQQEYNKIHNKMFLFRIYIKEERK